MMKPKKVSLLNPHTCTRLFQIVFPAVSLRLFKNIKQQSKKQSHSHLFQPDLRPVLHIVCTQQLRPFYSSSLTVIPNRSTNFLSRWQLLLNGIK